MRNLLGLLLLVAFWFHCGGDVAAQGSLTPPGSPAPLMKTLQQIEPRIDIATLPGDANSERIISTRGSYYLSGNLSVTKTNGIMVQTRDVVIDLNGFEISRVSSGSGDGISANVGGQNQVITVKNGTIIGFAFGIHAGAGLSNVIKDVAVYYCDNGIDAGSGAIVERCCATLSNGAGGRAIRVDDGVVSHCLVSGGSGQVGISIVNSTMDHCVVRVSNVVYGIEALNSSVVNCSANNTYNSAGFSAGIRAVASTVRSCTVAFTQSTAADYSGSQGMGIYADSSLILDCEVRSNKGDGIRVQSHSTVQRCNSFGNGVKGLDGAGVHADGDFNRVENNNVVDNDRGIDATGTVNLIFGNSARGNSSNYEIVAGNRVGAIVLPPTSGAITGNGPAAGLGTTDPWANFAY